jgi:sugar phosphate isomerase/epimerase
VPRPLGEDDLVLCSGTIARVSLPEAVPIAAAAGFRGLSVYESDYRAARADGWSDAALCSLLDDHDVAIAELDGSMVWLPGSCRGRSRDAFLDAAVALGARSVTALEVAGRLRLSDEVRAECFADLCDAAADRGLLVHLEFFPFSPVNDLVRALALVRSAGRANGGVMFDVWHYVRGPDAGAPIPDGTGAHVLGVQVNDVLPVASDELFHEMMHDRQLPGAGVAPVRDLLLALRSQGCTAPFGVEVYSDELDALGAEEAARRAADALRAVVG